MEKERVVAMAQHTSCCTGSLDLCVLGRIVGCESSRRVVSGSWGPQSFCFYICAWEKGGGYWDANNHMAGPYTFELAGGRRLIRALIIGFELRVFIYLILVHTKLTNARRFSLSYC